MEDWDHDQGPTDCQAYPDPDEKYAESVLSSDSEAEGVEPDLGDAAFAQLAEFMLEESGENTERFVAPQTRRATDWTLGEKDLNKVPRTTKDRMVGAIAQVLDWARKNDFDFLRRMRAALDVPQSTSDDEMLSRSRSLEVFVRDRGWRTLVGEEAHSMKTSYDAIWNREVRPSLEASAMVATAAMTGKFIPVGAYKSYKRAKEEPVARKAAVRTERPGLKRGRK